MKAKLRRILLVMFLVAGVAGLTTQTTRAASVEEIALMKSADRQKMLVEGAKQEGSVMFYTGLIVNQVVRPLKAAFEKKYPFINVEFFRGNSSRISQKLLSEYQADRHDVDVLSGSTATSVVQQAGFMQKFFSPEFSRYSDELKDPNGFWGVTNVYFLTPAYNTQMVQPNEVPKSYQDLLHPRWKGRMIWSTSSSSGGPMFIGNVLRTMGEEAGKTFLEKLKSQNVAKTTASNRQVVDQVVAGEYALALHIFNHHVYISQKKGAPVEWFTLGPPTATVSTIGLLNKSPRPHAAMLFIDFLLSEEGQKVFQAANYLPADPAIPALQADLKPGGGRFQKANVFNPETLFQKTNQWSDYFEKEFVN
ncbi:MAG: extracellular solute-binding protein [Deltaproteobacteria bacterium]|nr:extracellular solute-binding protein [Deltaproteobacteria bacterium]